LNSKKRFVLSHGRFFREEAKKPSDGAAQRAGRLWRHVRAQKEEHSLLRNVDY